MGLDVSEWYRVSMIYIRGASKTGAKDCISLAMRMRAICACTVLFGSVSVTGPKLQMVLSHNFRFKTCSVSSRAHPLSSSLDDWLRDSCPHRRSSTMISSSPPHRCERCSVVFLFSRPTRVASSAQCQTQNQCLASSAVVEMDPCIQGRAWGWKW